jgi:hypothetical protein
MSAILKTLLCRKEVLSMPHTATLWWLTDSENVAQAFRWGSGDIALMRLALQVLELTLELNLDLQAVWVSRQDPRLQKADALSKHVNSDDWSINVGAFLELGARAGGFTVDLFASAENLKVSRYYSFSYTSTCAGVDAFAHSWENEVVFCAPPIALILRSIRKIEITTMRGILLIPLWRFLMADI